MENFWKKPWIADTVPEKGIKKQAQQNSLLCL